MLELSNDRDMKRGKIGAHNLSGCQISLRQWLNKSLHIHINNNMTCWSNCSGDKDFFGSFDSSPSDCVKEIRQCVQNDSSTTQLWFGEHEHEYPRIGDPTD